MIREYRTIQEINGPLMVVRKVSGVTYDELVEVELPDGSVRRAKVLEVNGDTATVQLVIGGAPDLVDHHQRGGDLLDRAIFLNHQSTSPLSAMASIWRSISSVRAA